MARGTDDLVDLAAGRLAGLVDRYVPELVTGLHIIGSAMDGDFRPGRSDLDFVAVLSRAPTEEELEALAIIHRSYGSDPTMPLLDGIWITAADIAAGPDATPPGPTTSDSQFLELAEGNRNPVTWAQLGDARTARGMLGREAIWSDPARLVGWVNENAAGYWTRWHASSDGLWSPGGLALLRPATVMWCVLGICRLLYTAETGRIASKSGAGEWALGVVEPQWRPILAEALRIRRGEWGDAYRNPIRRRREALDFLAMMIGRITA